MPRHAEFINLVFALWTAQVWRYCISLKIMTLKTCSFRHISSMKRNISWLLCLLHLKQLINQLNLITLLSFPIPCTIFLLTTPSWKTHMLHCHGYMSQLYCCQQDLILCGLFVSKLELSTIPESSLGLEWLAESAFIALNNNPDF